MRFLFNKQYLFPPLFFLSISGLLVFSWFRFGLIYGGGDVGLQTYSPLRLFEISKYIWWEATAPGSTVPQGLIGIPFNFIFLLLQLTGFTPLALQASLFFLIIFFSGFGMYLFIKSELNQNMRFSILGGIFYIFNPYMMIQIWHRFVHSSFFLVTALPFLALFWIKWIRSGKVIYMILFLLTNLFSLYFYGTIAYIVTVWLFFTLIALCEIVFPWRGQKYFVSYGKRFLLGFLFWIFTNIWWLIPVFTISPSLLSEQHSTEESLVTLINISRQTIVPFSLQMVNPFYLFLQLDFGSFYQNIFVRIIPWFFVTIILAGFILGLKRQRAVKWSAIFLISILLTKGASSPFGHAFIFGFENSFALGVLRNPFEKIGILLPFTYSIFLVLGTHSISQFLIKRLGGQLQNIWLGFLILIILIFCWPMFNPGIFGKIGKPAFVKVPDSYISGNQFIKNDLENQEFNSNGKILHLPLTRGESTSYKWEYGYSGLEPSALFFESLPSLSHGFNIKRVDDSLASLYQIFHKSFDDPKKILKLLQDFNVKYIVLHKDVSWMGGDLYDPLATEEILNNLNFLEHKQSIGDLVIYKVPNQYFKPKVFLSSNIQLIFPSDKSFIWPWLIGGNQTMITPVDVQVDENIFRMAQQVLIFPKSSSFYPKESYILSAINLIAVDESASRFLLSFFTKIKPVLMQNGEIQSEKLNDRLISSTEKIFNSLRSQKQLGDIKTLPSSFPIQEYRQELNDIFSKELRKARLLFYVSEKNLSLIFQIHLIYLKLLSDQVDPTIKGKIDETYKFLQEQLVKNNFILQYPLNLNSEQTSDSQRVFHFQIPKDLTYEILMVDERPKSLLQHSFEKFKFTVNGQIPDFKIQEQEKSISLGNFDFKVGLWELGYESLVSSNLISSFDQLTKVGNVKLVDDAIKIEPAEPYGYIESLIPDAKGGDIYRISFEYLSQHASGFYFQLVQDTDTIDPSGQKVDYINEFIDLSKARTNWQNNMYTLLPLKPTTQKAGIKFGLPSNRQLPLPSFLIKNIKIERVLSNDLVLKGVINNEMNQENGGLVLNIDQRTPVLLRGKINVANPTFLIFSETFHPGWKLKLTDGRKTIYPKKHFMANLYANSWFLEYTGEYNFSIEFEPQRVVGYGAIIAFATYIVLLTFMLWKRFER